MDTLQDVTMSAIRDGFDYILTAAGDEHILDWFANIRNASSPKDGWEYFFNMGKNPKIRYGNSQIWHLREKNNLE